MAYLKTLVFLIATVSMFSAGVGNEAIADPGPTTTAIKPWVYGGYVHAHWTPDGNEFWYESFGNYWRRTFWWVNAATGKRTPVFDGAKLHAALDKTKLIPSDAEWMEVNDIRRLGADELQLDIDGLRFRYNPTTNAIAFVTEITTAARPLVPLKSLIAGSDSEEETTITFINHKFQNASVWSVDALGVQREIAPLNRRECPAYVGNVFVVKSDKGEILGVYQAVGDPSQAVVDDLPDPTNQPTTQPTSLDGNSPDGKLQVIFRNYNILIRDRKTGQESLLTVDGRSSDGYHDDTTYIWSPDSTKLLAGRTKYNGSPLLLIQSSPPDQLRPKLLTQIYPRPIDSINEEEPHLFDVLRHKEIPIRPPLSFKSLRMRWLNWDPDSTHVDLECIGRGYRYLQMISIDALTGRESVLIDEAADTFVDIVPDYKYNRFSFPQTNEFIWTSERDGWNHAYLYDATSGHLKNQITKGPWVVRDIKFINAQTRQLWCQVSGLVPGEDPYNIHICRINFDGTGLIDLTPAEGTHDVSFSPDGRFYLDTYSRTDLPPVTELRRSGDASLICAVEKADWSDLLASGWRPPERFSAKGRDGTTDIYGLIFRPMHFDASKKYPIIEDVYADPYTSHVPKEFIRDYRNEDLANLGFIIVQIDGMGTNFRSKAFHDVCWHNMADAGFPDRIKWIKAAAAKYPQMDLSRVGIFGTSRGGDNAVRALESHADFYSVAVAGFGVYDERLIFESECWLGWPVGPWYAEQSDVTDAANIKGKLLLISGELDHIADPSSTMRMVDALIKADKDFDMLVIPNADHDQYGDYGDRRVRDFFVHNLLKK